MQPGGSQRSVSVESKAKAEKTLDWLTKTLQRRLSHDGDFGRIAVEIKVQDGEIAGSVILVDEQHLR